MKAGVWTWQWWRLSLYTVWRTWRDWQVEFKFRFWRWYEFEVLGGRSPRWIWFKVNLSW